MNSSTRLLYEDMVHRIDQVVREAETAAKPIEIEPYRGQLFELFVMAEGGGYLEEEAELDLTAEELCRVLGERWGIGEAAREATARQSKLPPAHLARMRSLWSLLRMWMEWDYAWKRWNEFHTQHDAVSKKGESTNGTQDVKGD